MYLHAIYRIISYLIHLKPANRRPSRLQRLGVGGVTIIIGLLGLILWLFTVHKYQLVLRNEELLFNTPAVFVHFGLALALLTVLWIWCLCVLHQRKLGWRLFQGPSQGGAPRWEDVLLLIIPAVIYGTVGAGKFINAAFDRSPTQTQQSKIIRRYTQEGPKGGKTYHLLLADWNNSEKLIPIQINSSTYQSHRTSAIVTIKTKRGFLGYEWVEEFK